MEGLTWIFIGGGTALSLFLAWWAVDVAVRAVFRRVDKKGGSLSIADPERAQHGE